MGMDDTIERRKGEKIKAKGIYRDPVRPLSQSFCHALVASAGFCLMLLAEIPWASASMGKTLFNCSSTI